MKNSFFDYNGKIFNFFQKTADLLILNLLFVLCCLPVFTIGASICGFWDGIFQIKSTNCTFSVKRFFQVFRLEFKKSTICFLLFLMIGAFLILDFYLAAQMNGWYRITFFTLFLCFTFLLFLTGMYTFAFLIHYNNTIGNMLQNGFLAVFLFGKESLGLILIWLIPVFFMVIIPDYISLFLLVLSVIGFSCLGYLSSFLILNCYEKLDTKK